MKHPPISKRIDQIFRQFYKNAGREKFSSIIREGQEFVRAHEIKNELSATRINFGVDNLRVKSVVESYFFDVIKYKEYHFNPKGAEETENPLSEAFLEKIHQRNQNPENDKIISEAKVAAFTVKWLSRYSPIYAHPIIKESELTPKEKSIILRINTFFAIDHGLSLMGLRLNALPNGVVDDLHYHLLYRTVDDRSLILAFSCLHRCIPAKSS